MKTINSIIKQPKYYDKFSCIGGECPASCCIGWGIVWKQDEINKLKDCSCSHKLTELIDTSFFPLNEKDSFRISLDCNGKCPFLTEEKLCRIQKEIGAKYLSDVCSNYPRISIHHRNITTRSCTSSCYAVLDLICYDESSMDIILKDSKNKTILTKKFKANVIEEKPELVYLNEIFDFIYDILFDKKRDIETSVILAALAAKKISEFAENENTEMIPEIISTLKPQLKDKAQIERINNIKPNYIFSIGVINDIFTKMYSANILFPLYTDGIVNVDKYKIGMTKFNEFFAENSYAIKNIILNLFMEFFSSNYNTNYTIYDNFLYFVVCAASAKLVCASTSLVCETKEQAHKLFLVSQSNTARNYISNRQMIGNVTNYLKEHNWHTIGYLASMIK